MRSFLSLELYAHTVVTGTMRYTIALSGATPYQSRARLEETRARQFRSWSLPSGTSLEEMADRFAEIDHGGRKARALAEGAELPDEVHFVERMFDRPNRSVKSLRALAREGSEREKAREEAEKSMPKIVWTPAEGTDATGSLVELPSTSTGVSSDTADIPSEQDYISPESSVGLKDTA
jgi:hypothetical protein